MISLFWSSLCSIGPHVFIFLQLKEIIRSFELSGLSTLVLSARLGLGGGSVVLKKAVVSDWM